MAFDLRYLASFVVLAEELQFSRAATRLCITQSALSQQIARLEAQLQVCLFERTRRQVKLSDAGLVLLGHARPLLAGVERATAHVRLAQQGKVGRLTVGYVDAAPFSGLSALVVAYRTQYPEVELSLLEMSTNEQLTALENGRLDIGLMRPLHTPDWLRQRLLDREPYVLAMHSGHPLAKAPAIHVAQLASEAFIATSAAKASYIRSRFDRLFRRHGFSPKVVQEVNQLASLLSLVGAGLGIALLPTSVVRHNTHEVVFRPLADADAPLAELMIGWHAEREPGVLKRFVDTAHQVYGRGNGRGN